MIFDEKMFIASLWKYTLNFLNWFHEVDILINIMYIQLGKLYGKLIMYTNVQFQF